LKLPIAGSEGCIVKKLKSSTKVIILWGVWLALLFYIFIFSWQVVLDFFRASYDVRVMISPVLEFLNIASALVAIIVLVWAIIATIKFLLDYLNNKDAQQ